MVLDIVEARRAKRDRQRRDEEEYKKRDGLLSKAEPQIAKYFYDEIERVINYQLKMGTESPVYYLKQNEVIKYALELCKIHINILEYKRIIEIIKATVQHEFGTAGYNVAFSDKTDGNSFNIFVNC